MAGKTYCNLTHTQFSDKLGLFLYCWEFACLWVWASKIRFNLFYEKYIRVLAKFKNNGL